MTALKVTTVGEQVAVLVTPEIAKLLQLTVGGEVQAVKSAGGIELLSSAEVARQLELARGVMEEDREALSRLAE